MILLRSLRLETFKGIERLTCEFEDLTVLAGLNNAGKTSVLQAIYLLVSTLPPLGEHPHLVSTNEKQRTVDLTSPLATLGLPSFDWLLQGPETPFMIAGTFWNGCTVQIRMVRRGRFCFSVTGENDSLEHDAAQRMLRELNQLSAELFRPPGVLSSRERMFATGDQYRQQVASGQGNLYWRNSIWWGIQAAGQESFRPVQEMVERHFLQVVVHQPVLATEGDPHILIKYKEGNRSPLDIAQAGAGLHTFIALAQLIEQSKANFLLLDEPDAHLHASQQALVLDLLTEVALGERQVFIATHSSELLARVTRDSIRWLHPGSERVEGGVDTADLLDRLGVAPNIYISKSDFPDIIVYVEGKQDKPLMEALIAWSRERKSGLPTTLIVRHNAGRFGAVALQAISRMAREAEVKTRVVGIRDLDFDYFDTLPPPEEAEKHEGDGYVLVTLMCKELENLLCEAELLHEAAGQRIEKDLIERIIDEESQDEKLVTEWRHHAVPQIRDRFPKKEEDHTRERKAEEEFHAWAEDSALRVRLVAGKALFSRIRRRLRDEHDLPISSRHLLRNAKVLPAAWQELAETIFPELKPGVLFTLKPKAEEEKNNEESRNEDGTPTMDQWPPQVKYGTEQPPQHQPGLSPTDMHPQKGMTEPPQPPKP